ncbi:MAG: type 4 pilus major pilin [Alphaproteobacteria bacterium]
MQRPGKTPRGGFTITELAIVMALFGLIAGAIWVAASGARESQKEGDALNELQTVVQNVGLLMTGQTFQGATGNQTSNLITAQAIPSSYAVAGGTAINPWGGAFAVWQTNGTNQFRASFYGTGTTAGCIALLTKGTSCQAIKLPSGAISAQSGCPTQVGTGGTITTPPTSTLMPAVGSGWAGTMSVSAAKTLCLVNGNSSVEFYYSP